MKALLKKYPTESMGVFLAFILLVLIAISMFIPPVGKNIITIPYGLSVGIFSSLLLGSLGIYVFSIWDEVHSWRKWSEVFIMLGMIFGSFSNVFSILMAIATIIIIFGNIQQKTLNIKNPILYLWIAMVVISIVSSSFAIDSKSLSFTATVGVLVYFLHFVSVYNQNFVQERGEVFVQRVGVLLSLNIIISVIFSLWHFKFFPYIMDIGILKLQHHTGYGNSFGMASIYMGWPTHSSAFLCVAFWTLIGIFNYCKQLSSIHKKIIVCGIVFSLVGALFTLSRNAFMFLVLSIGIMLLIQIIKTKQKRWWGLLGSSGVFFCGVLWYLVTNFEKWENLFANPLQQRTIADRIAQYQFMLREMPLIDTPLTGIGLMNFGTYYRRVMDNPQLPDYLHQLFLSMAFETGYIGVTIFSMLMFLVGKTIVKNYQKNPSNQIFVVVFFSWIATGMFDNWLYLMWPSTLFMILFALGSREDFKEE